MTMAEKPKLYVCHGDQGGPRLHPCRRVQEALREAGIEYDKEIAAHGSPIPFLRKGSREKLREETGTTKLPVMKLADGTVLTPSKAILGWIAEQADRSTTGAADGAGSALGGVDGPGVTAGPADGAGSPPS
jgi:glutathione S-transferase